MVAIHELGLFLLATSRIPLQLSIFIFVFPTRLWPTQGYWARVCSPLHSQHSQRKLSNICQRNEKVNGSSLNSVLPAQMLAATWMALVAIVQRVVREALCKRWPLNGFLQAPFPAFFHFYFIEERWEETSRERTSNPEELRCNLHPTDCPETLNCN